MHRDDESTLGAPQATSSVVRRFIRKKNSTKITISAPSSSDILKVAHRVGYELALAENVGADARRRRAGWRWMPRQFRVDALGKADGAYRTAVSSRSEAPPAPSLTDATPRLRLLRTAGALRPYVGQRDGRCTAASEPGSPCVLSRRCCGCVHAPLDDVLVAVFVESAAGGVLVQTLRGSLEHLGERDAVEAASCA